MLKCIVKHIYTSFAMVTAENLSACAIAKSAIFVWYYVIMNNYLACLTSTLSALGLQWTFNNPNIINPNPKRHINDIHSNFGVR